MLGQQATHRIRIGVDPAVRYVVADQQGARRQHRRRIAGAAPEPTIDTTGLPSLIKRQPPAMSGQLESRYR
jgi:hypothetical protein